MGLRWAERTKLLILLISVIFTGDLILINQIASENHFFLRERTSSTFGGEK